VADARSQPESDSCFAKILQGSHVADIIQKLPYTNEGGLHILKQPVLIKSIKIVKA
jgi:hypothetical protein